MTETVSGALWPYLVVILVGFLPSEVWRVLGALLSRGLTEESAVLAWVRTVATTLLAAVVAKLLIGPSGALAGLPLASRIASLLVGLAGYFLLRRSVFAAVILGEVTLVLLAALHAG
ncbi:MAG TPA: AzlD domain-containing protein [Microvirga sp.]|nr:AzlD domain-containing protein [Microvirga sp.]